ncbi:hypothetical protein A6R68_06462 [Neotoma lepida]|uniref:Uncharacterized protein n=1 Tax=Neotoma lepida TaxID=56216 RepID=A0A1A6GGI7_NEOLE|nr:hypothetical protein A6R68_06462 [Neotoma lepida]
MEGLVNMTASVGPQRQDREWKEWEEHAPLLESELLSISPGPPPMPATHPPGSPGYRPLQQPSHIPACLLRAWSISSKPFPVVHQMF